MKSISTWFLARLAEPSTLSGIATLVLVAQHAVASHDWNSVAASVFAIGAMLFKESGAQA